MRIETKARIYKATIRAIMTYTAETRPKTTKTRRILKTTEIKILRKIAGKTMLDRERNENIRRKCGTKDVNQWLLGRKNEWNQYINRMEDTRVVKIARDKSPLSRRSIVRPRKDEATI